MTQIEIIADRSRLIVGKRMRGAAADGGYQKVRVNDGCSGITSNGEEPLQGMLRALHIHAGINGQHIIR